MRRRLIALAAVAAAAAGCGTQPVAGSGAASYRPPGTALAAGSSAAASSPETAAGAPVAGGQPIDQASVEGGAGPAASPPVVVRGVTWAARANQFSLVAGGYKALYSVAAEKNPKTKQPYQCTVSFSITGAGGAVLYRTPPQAPGSGQGTFVVPAPVPAAQATGTGPVGCNWALTLIPA